MENVQPNGVDLTVDEIYRIMGSAKFTSDGYIKPERIPLEVIRGEFDLSHGAYVIVYGEEVEIPEGHVGLVLPRSRFLRSGLHITSALWDQGYEGIGEGLLQVPQSINSVTIERGSSVAQMTFIEAEDATEFLSYDGTHQGERL